MHERHDLEHQLKDEAGRISADLGGASVVVIAAGSSDAGLPRTMLASRMVGRDQRLRDLIGILETSIQIETLKHFRTSPFD